MLKTIHTLNFIYACDYFGKGAIKVYGGRRVNIHYRLEASRELNIQRSNGHVIGSQEYIHAVVIAR